MCFLRETIFLFPEDIDDIFADWDFFHKYLHDALDRRLRLGTVPRTENPIDATDFHAVFLLAHKGDHSALPKLLEMLKMKEEDLNQVFGDVLTEHLFLPIAQTGHLYIKELQKFYLSISKDDIAQYPISSGLIWMPFFHPEIRSDIVSFFIELSASPQITIHEDTMAGYFGECAAARLDELKDTAFAFARSMKLDQEPILFRPRDIYAAFDHTLSTSFHPPLSIYSAYDDMFNKFGLPDYDDDIIDEYEEENEIKDFMNPNILPFPIVGRNELCPCGSGKKFKHCHGKYIN